MRSAPVLIFEQHLRRSSAGVSSVGGVDDRKAAYRNLEDLHRPAQERFMGKNIAIFADGTGNTVGNYDTNVLRLCKMVDIRNLHQQLVIYDPGVGTRDANPVVQRG